MEITIKAEPKEIVQMLKELHNLDFNNEKVCQNHVFPIGVSVTEEETKNHQSKWIDGVRTAYLGSDVQIEGHQTVCRGPDVRAEGQAAVCKGLDSRAEGIPTIHKGNVTINMA